VDTSLVQRSGAYLSAAAVVLSLIFVGLEVRNNTVAARGATMQAISDASTTFFLTISLDKDFAELVVRIFDGETKADFSPIENQQLVQNIGAFMRGLENTYLQHREGLVPDAVFESYGWNDGITSTPYFRDYWEQNASGMIGAEFMRFFESRKQIGPD